ncbi:MAG: DNA-deoxyinosine glycosylase [Clostridiales bacterium]|jgi:hypoxanthine-DNA glycosylase|nr:DNA-deoxyinosine glycosylase [Clostridiales bacterium]
MSKEIVCRAFPPLYGDKPRLLILGTFPSPLSRQKGEYYGNPRNQFWRLIFGVFDEPFDNPDYDTKKAILFRNGIALCDVIIECMANGALDSGIRNPVYRTELSKFIAAKGISRVFFNGNNAYLFYRRGIGEIERRVLPSGSPAYAGMRFEEKLRLWRERLQCCL